MIVTIAALALITPATSASPAANVEQVRASAPFKAALADLDTGHDRFVDEIIELTEIPAPPFKEARRAEAYAAKFRALGLTDVTIDAEGNVTALRPGTDPGARLIVVSAHLDTVFPEGTPVKVRREGTRLYAPGVGDDTRGLALLLAYGRALDAAKVRTRHPILFVGTVGEEGRGDLRGVRHLLTKGPYRGRIGAFLSFDSDNPTVLINGGVGSKRYHVVFKGPGGHSYGAFGIVNPMAAMSDAVTRLYAIKPPAGPRTTYAATITGGGTSVNAIPSEVFMDFDMRSEDPAALAALEKRFLGIVAAAVDTENTARSTHLGKLTADPQPIGNRPAGTTPRTAPLVATAAAAISAFGYSPQYHFSSTDSNIAMSLGIPALTMASGGVNARSHSIDEWIDVAKPESLRASSAGLLTLVTTAGMISE